MGEVYLAYDTLLERKIAIKIIRVRSRVGDATIPDRVAEKIERRLYHEARALAQLDHPGIVDVFDVGAEDSQIFIAMDYIQGQTLRQWWRNGDQDWRALAKVMLQIGRALAACHARGLVHRDMKPENVMIDGQGRAFLIDFGIALDDGDDGGQLDASLLGLPDSVEVPSGPRTRLTDVGHRVGTPGYMAPEQDEGHSCEARSDQFAFCVSMIELLTGERPEASDRELQARRVFDTGASDAPAWLERLLVKGLACRSSERHPSMTVLCDAIEEQLSEASWTARARSWAYVAMFVVVAGIWAWMVSPLAAIQPCADAEDRWQGVWDDASKQAIHAAFAATNLSYAQHTWQRAEVEIDEYVEDWSINHDRACEAARAGAKSDAMTLDARMQCMQGVASDLELLLATFRHADARVLEHATSSIADLPSITTCNEATRLVDADPMPVRSEDRRVVQALRETMAAIHAALALARASARTRQFEIAASAMLRAERIYRVAYGSARWPQIDTWRALNREIARLRGAAIETELVGPQG